MSKTILRIDLAFLGAILCQFAWASKILVAMDDSQTNHLKAYGVAFGSLRMVLKLNGF